MGAFATFLTAITGVVRYLINYHFDKQNQVNVEKSKLDLSVERLKADNSLRTIEGLSKVVIEIIPMVKHHEEVVKKLDDSVQMVGMIEKNLTTMVKPLKEQYEEFNRVIPKATASLMLVMEDVAKIKTEILQLKKGSGNVFVTTKK
jgi:hypothetical protein